MHILSHFIPDSPQWGDWGEWGSCSLTCDEGTKQRSRTCNGIGCVGDNQESTTCTTAACPGMYVAILEIIKLLYSQRIMLFGKCPFHAGPS